MSARRRDRGAPPEAGVALLITVWLVALLAVIAGEFMASGRVRAAAERNKRDDLVGLSLALAGYRAAVAALDDEIAGLSRDGDDQLLIHYRGATAGVPAAAADVPFAGGTFSWTISDEDGLVNLNDPKSAGSSTLARLLEKCGLGPGVERDTIIDSVLDWRDKNREHHLNGAEEDYYRSLDPPYSCKDGPFDVVEELLLVKGIRENPRLFFGGEVDGEKWPGLRDLVTPHSDPGGRFNAGTAPQAVLEALGRQRPAGPTPPSLHFAIVATGKPAGRAPPRSLRAVVRRDGAAGGSGGFDFTLVYYNDTYMPE